MENCKFCSKYVPENDYRYYCKHWKKYFTKSEIVCNAYGINKMVSGADDQN